MIYEQISNLIRNKNTIGNNKIQVLTYHINIFLRKLLSIREDMKLAIFIPYWKGNKLAQAYTNYAYFLICKIRKRRLN